MLKITLLSSLLAFSLLFQACSSDSKKDKAQEANALLAKNEIVLTSTNKKQYVLKKVGEGFTLEDSKAKILILDIFATWCPPCQGEASALTAIQKKFGDKVKVIGVTIEDNIPNAKLESFKKNYSADYTLVNSSENRRLVNTLAENLKLGKNFGIPLLVIYKDGKLIHYYQGATEEEFIESDIKKALGI
jgi:thiol-disulfide isomerase/thioredoxin